MKVALLVLALVALLGARHVHNAVVGGPVSSVPWGNNNFQQGGGNWAGPNSNFGGSSVGPSRPGPWNGGSVTPNPWNGGSAGRLPNPNPWNGGSVAPNPWNGGGSVGPRPNPWNGGSVAPNPWNGGGSVGPRPNPWNGGSSGSWVGGRSTSLSGVTCSNGQVNPLSVGSAYYAGPTRMSCNNQFGAPIYHDVCTSLQQCANLMCQRYVRCTGRLSMSAA